MLKHPTTVEATSSFPTKATVHAADTGVPFPWDPKLRSIKQLTDRGEYKLALERLSKSTSDHESMNCRGVCLLRMREFSKAIGPLRLIALNASTFRVHDEVAKHIKLNFALALFFGGEAAGGLETLSQIDGTESDPSAMMMRQQARQWSSSMSWFRRLDWYLNRIAPKQGPIAPDEPVGRFVWDLDRTE
ncbi:hypothetical protein [Aureliella helgolandensis]|nr:hypothetical protein [Aureliella helgolandensis]